mmetsp:Transcript_20189/g.54091  ORF Transcript_20189/g.54091 Transcript_20189/m.54091 type:complete len:151 (-) Transcript_20189:99-551(-)
MGNCHKSSAYDAYGNWLEEGCWVECAHDRSVDNAAGPGRVRFIADDRVTFEWPVFGSYIYNADDIRRYGIVKVLADKDGRKLLVDQLVEMKDGSEGIVASMTDTTVTINYTTKDWHAGTHTFSQRDIEEHGVKISVALGQRRHCIAGPCM